MKALAVPNGEKVRFRYSNAAKPVAFNEKNLEFKSPRKPSGLRGLEYLGRLMGLEPTTTGITIRDSTN